MGLFKFAKGILKATVEVALVPIDVVADTVTGCGMATDQEKPYTIRRLERAKKSAEKALDSLEDDEP